MRTILIVDDEKKIRQGLCAMIKRFDFSFDNILEAKNGKDAIDIINKQTVDIVLTDIIMPIMGGIELVKYISQLTKKPYVIILSGHDDFNYAKVAITTGVRAYLLKPVDRTELFEMIEKILVDVKKDKIIELDVESNKSFKPIIDELREEFLTYLILNENTDENTFKNKISLLGLELLEKEFYISILVKKTNFSNCELNIKATQIIKNFYYPNEVICLEEKNKQIIIISNNKIDVDLIAKLNIECNSNYVLGISEKGLNINKQYLQAKLSSSYRTFIDSDIILYEYIKNKKTALLFPEQDMKKISNMIIVNRIKEANELLKTIFSNSDLNIDYYLKIIDELYIAIFNCIPKNEKELLNEIFIMKDIYNFSTINEYISNMEKYFNLIGNAILNNLDLVENVNSIEKAINFIKLNYTKNIDLAMVSNHVSLNYYYFSQLFKSSMGLNFTDYLKKIRIEKSKELLRTTDSKIYQIAAQVGFSNQKHFMKSFRIETGVSPKEYRNLK